MPKKLKEKPTPQHHLEQGRFHYQHAGNALYIEGLFDDKAAAKGAAKYLRAENALPKDDGYSGNRTGAVITISKPRHIDKFEALMDEIKDVTPDAELVKIFEASKLHYNVRTVSATAPPLPKSGVRGTETEEKSWVERTKSEPQQLGFSDLLERMHEHDTGGKAPKR